ncbi:MAG: NTP transferase domain-containing protein, partial [Paracoccaceae bacterium]
MATALIILAAGRGTRMNSDTPKVLHKLGGVPLFAHAMAAGQALQPDKTVLVVGYGGAEVARTARDLDPTIEIVEQGEQLGTGHAVAQARAILRDFAGDVVVLYGDTPFVQRETLQQMAQQRADHDLVVLGFEAGDAGGYGRLVMAENRLLRIVEAAACKDEERAITFCNSGILMAPCGVLFDLIDDTTKQKNNQIYLTDAVEVANDRGLSATAIACAEAETLGINSRAQLVEAEAVFQARARRAAIQNGVSLSAPETVFLSLDTVLGRDVTVEPNVCFGPGVSVET